MNPIEETIRDLASEYSREIINTIGKKDMLKVIQRNRNEPNEIICHSHDFCDSNQVMIDVFSDYMGRDLDLTNAVDFYLVNQSMDLAKASDFYLDPKEY